MKYEDIVEGQFIDRPNRFVANVIIDGVAQKVHVKNTGRCKELLEKGNTVYLEDFRKRMGTRKLPYSLINVYKNCSDGSKLLINMDSQAPNKVVHEALLNGKISLPGMDKLNLVKPEQKFQNSRFDFYAEDIKGTAAYIEVKGCTLERDGIAFFPDAPTARGSKHIHELMEAAAQGYGAYVVLVIQIENIKLFKPNRETDPDFADALAMADKSGVKILAYNCNVSKDTLEINEPIEIQLD